MKIELSEVLEVSTRNGLINDGDCQMSLEHFDTDVLIEIYQFGVSLSFCLTKKAVNELISSLQLLKQ